VITCGLLALARLRLGDPEGARQNAAATLQRIERSRPAAFSVIDGYTGAFDVFLELGDRAQAKRMVKGLRKLAKAFPMTVPAVRLREGEFQRAFGGAAGARRAFEQALHRARDLGMPREEAAAHLALARAEPDGSTARATHLDEAQARFERMQCAWHLRQVAALRGNR
jgi:hypothetical protein